MPLRQPRFRTMSTRSVSRFSRIASRNSGSWQNTVRQFPMVLAGCPFSVVERLSRTSSTVNSMLSACWVAGTKLCDSLFNVSHLLKGKAPDLFAKSNALKLNILFFCCFSGWILSVRYPAWLFQESKNGFLGLFLNLLFASLLDFRLHQLLLDFVSADCMAFLILEITPSSRAAAYSRSFAVLSVPAIVPSFSFLPPTGGPPCGSPAERCQ